MRPTVTARTKDTIKGLLRGRGYELRRVEPAAGETRTPPPSAYPPPADHLALEADFRAAAREIEQRHAEQTVGMVAALAQKYREPLFGEVKVWGLVERLSLCVDPTDCRLFCASQQTHVCQMLEAMERDGVSDPDLLLAVLIHDLGKLLLLVDEDPAHVACMNVPIGDYEPGSGLDNCVLQWNHDEFGYQRFKDHVPDHVAWLIRYHSIEPGSCDDVMDERDRRYADQYLRVFSHYDHATKSPYALPRRSIADYRDVIEDAFPRPIPF